MLINLIKYTHSPETISTLKDGYSYIITGETSTTNKLYKIGNNEYICIEIDDILEYHVTNNIYVYKICKNEQINNFKILYDMRIPLIERLDIYNIDNMSSKQQEQNMKIFFNVFNKISKTINEKV